MVEIKGLRKDKDGTTTKLKTSPSINRILYSEVNAKIRTLFLFNSLSHSIISLQSSLHLKFNVCLFVHACTSGLNIRVLKKIDGDGGRFGSEREY